MNPVEHVGATDPGPDGRAVRPGGARLGSSVTVALALFAFALPARGQFPIPGLEDPPAPEPRSASESVDTATVATNEKAYDRPAQRPLPEGPVTPGTGKVVLLEFDGIVNPGMASFVIDSIERASEEGAQMVLIEMDTPGGLVSSTQKMVQAIMGSDVPVVVYVTPSGAHAASAGTFLTLAAHVAAMAPATRIGAAHPITGGGKDPEAAGGKHAARKIENDLLAMVEGIARQRGRNAEWAKDAVRDSVSADAEKAARIGVVDLVADDRASLFEAIDGRVVVAGGTKVRLDLKDPSIERYAPSLRARLLNLLANPGVMALLGLLGLLCIMIEFYNPGMVVPGVVGAILILCSLLAVEQMPIDVGAGLLVLAGIGLLVAELYTPTFGALGFVGLVGLGLGLVLLVDIDDPSFDLDPSFALSMWDVMPLLVMLGGFFAYLSVFVVRRKRQPSSVGLESLVGRVGKVLRPVGPEGGQVFVEGEYWKARTLDPEPINVGERVRVVQTEGLSVVVSRDTDS